MLKKIHFGPRMTCKMKLLKSWLILFRDVSCTTWKQKSNFRVLLTRLRTTALKNKWVYVVHEDLVGGYKTGKTKAEKVTKSLKNKFVLRGKRANHSYHSYSSLPLRTWLGRVQRARIRLGL